jgi:predicted  nucleic acid-binding Zn-ribbon protein
MQDYEREYHSFENKIGKLEEELASALKAKEELKDMFEEESRVKNEAEGQLRESVWDLEERHVRLEKQHRQTCHCL